MKINQKIVRNLIMESIKKNLLLEGNFSDSLAGKMAYVAAMGIIVTMAARHAEKSLREDPSKIDVRAPIKAQIDFTQDAESLIRGADFINPIYRAIRFLRGIVDQPGAVFAMRNNPTFEKIVGVNLKQLIEDIAKTHDVIKEELKLSENLGDQLPHRKRTKMLENFSGIFVIDASYSFASSNIALGAVYNPHDQSIGIKMNFSKMLYDIFEEGLSEEEINQVFAETMKWSQNGLQQIKGGMTHELVHATQLDTFQSKQGLIPTVKGMINPVKQRLALNLKSFDDIDEKFFPILRDFQEMLEQYINNEIGGFLSSEENLIKYDLTRSHGFTNPWRGMQSLHERGETNEETFKKYKLATAITFFSILANVFSPQEVEAYVRGDYVAIKKKIAAEKSRRSSAGMKMSRYSEFEMHSIKKYGHFFDSKTVPEWVGKLVGSLSGGKYDLYDLWHSAIGGMNRVYASIYGEF
jgi:hypothetical protein